MPIFYYGVRSLRRAGVYCGAMSSKDSLYMKWGLLLAASTLPSLWSQRAGGPRSGVVPGVRAGSCCCARGDGQEIRLVAKIARAE
jgi:hypothetical protein